MNVFQLLLIFALPIVYGKVIDVFSSINSIEFSGDGSSVSNPANPYWILTMNYSFDGFYVYIDDTFTLTMPCVYGFGSNDTSVDVYADYKVLFNCEMVAGETMNSNSQLNCKMEQDGGPYSFSGTIWFPIVFNNGWTGGEVGSKCAGLLSGGNEVTFTSGSQTFTYEVSEFETGIESNSSVFYSDYYNNLMEDSIVYLLASECPNGYIFAEIGFTVSTSIEEFSFFQGYTDNLNQYLYPIDYTATNFVTFANETSYIVNFTNIAAGSRPFIYMQAQISRGSQWVYYVNNAQCVGSSEETDSSVSQYYYFDQFAQNTDVVIVTTTTWGESTTNTQQITGTDGTRTVLVEVPTPTTVITHTWDQSYTSMTTYPYTVGGTVTVVMDMPVATKTNTWTGSTTYTSLSTNGDAETFEVYVPIPTVYTTLTWLGAVNSYSTQTASIGGTYTVGVYIPMPTVTFLETWNGSTTSTSYGTAILGQNETIVIYAPIPTVTITEQWNSPTTETMVHSASIGHTATATVFIPSSMTEPASVAADVDIYLESSDYGQNTRVYKSFSNSSTIITSYY